MYTSNPFHAFKDRNINQRLSLSGVFLGLAILFQYLEQYMPFASTFVKFNFSLVFILPIFYFSGPIFGLTTIGICFGVGYAFSAEPPVQRLVGQTILLIATLLTIAYMYVFSFVFKKVKKHNTKIICISISVVGMIAITLTLLNGLWFTPFYMWASGKDMNTFIVSHPFDVKGAIDAYEGKYSFYYQMRHFFIPKYWGGIFAVYIPANIIKFGLIYVIYYPLSKVLNFYLKK